MIISIQLAIKCIFSMFCSGKAAKDVHKSIACYLVWHFQITKKASSTNASHKL